MTSLRSRRGFVAILALVAHLALLWLALNLRPAPVAHEPVYMSLQVSSIQVPPGKEPPPLRPPPPTRRSVTPAPSPAATTPPQLSPPEDRAPDTAITLPPGTGGIDWGLEAGKAARAFAAPAQDTQRSLESRPEVLVLPERMPAQPRKGDMDIGLDGSVGVWTTDEIYCVSSHRLMDQFEIWASSIPPHCRKVARRKPKLVQEYDLP